MSKRLDQLLECRNTLATLTETVAGLSRGTTPKTDVPRVLGSVIESLGIAAQRLNEAILSEKNQAIIEEVEPFEAVAFDGLPPAAL